MTDIRVSIEKVLMDPVAGSSLLILKEEGGERKLPIWVGQPEAFSIAVALEKAVLPRPMTHDLTMSLLRALGASVAWVRVHDLKDGVYYAWIRIEHDRGGFEADARPSDAIALAVREGAPVFVSDDVFAKAQSGEQPQASVGGEGDLESLSEDVFGKYKM
ncbi:MAG: bifunctional nuclease family protein [Deltaproteobacteria bacterium]|nr:bifunctional nuclease family protein [Deltaproteobacteria bacterium]